MKNLRIALLVVMTIFCCGLFWKVEEKEQVEEIPLVISKPFEEQDRLTSEQKKKILEEIISSWPIEEYDSEENTPELEEEVVEELVVPEPEPEPEKFLSCRGICVVIDAGHGGTDPGSNTLIEEIRMCEDEYVYDIANRLGKLIQENGGVVLYTLVDLVQKREISNFSYVSKSERTGEEKFDHRIIPDARDERSTIDLELMTADKSGLDKRSAVGNFALALYPFHRVVFVSIHVDWVRYSRNRDIMGAYTIVPRLDMKTSNFIQESFRSNGLSRRRTGLELSSEILHGNKSGYRVRLRVLRNDMNWVNQRVLVEVGHIRNENDQSRLLLASGRQHYAEILFSAIEKVNQIPFELCRFDLSFYEVHQ